MFDAQNILKSLIKGKSKGSGSLGVGDLLSTRNILLGLGAAGAAYMAHKHLVGAQGEAPTAPPVPLDRLPPPQMRGGALPPVPPAFGNPTPVPAPPQAVASVDRDRQSMLLIRAMIAAANADHEIDDEERRRILAKAELFSLDPEERAALEAELLRPLSVHQVVEEARRLGCAGRQIFAASFLAISADTPGERAYLRRLAEGLGLPEAEAQDLERVLS